MRTKLFGKKERVKSRLIAWLFKEKDEVSQEPEKPANPVEASSAVEPSTVTVNVKADMEVVPEENADVEMSENNGREETEFRDIDHYAEDLPVEDSLVADSRYNDDGLDCAGFSREYYQKRIKVLLDRICRAGRQMQDGNYDYSMFDLRYSLGAGLKMLLRHKGLETGTLEENIERCRMNCLISDEMAGGLHGVRKIGNCNEHSDYAQNNLTFNKVYFSVMETLEFLSVVEIWLLWPEPLPELSAAWAREPITLKSVMEEEKEKKENEEK